MELRNVNPAHAASLESNVIYPNQEACKVLLMREIERLE